MQSVIYTYYIKIHIDRNSMQRVAIGLLELFLKLYLIFMIKELILYINWNFFYNEININN